MIIPLGWLLLPVLAFNLAAFGAQGLDKRQAGQGTRRVSERTLLLLGLPLASPGILLGMKVFRHKTRKASFLAKAVVVVFANLLTLAALGLLAMQGVLRFDLRLY